MVIKDIERDEVEFICKVFKYYIHFQTIGTVPVAHIDQLTPEKLGSAKLVEEVTLSDDSKIVKVTGVKEDCKTITMLIRGSSKLVNFFNFY